MIKKMKKLQIAVISIFFLSFLTIISPEIKAQETLTVGPGGDFSKIADAIANANESDIILVYSGTYTENIVINKSITITGNGSASTQIISANNNKNTIEVTADNVNLSGFNIKNLGGDFACVQLNSADYCQILNNHIENGENSIYLINSNNNIIKDNTVEDSKNGIYLWTSNNNIINSNNIQKNEIYGVFISSYSTENTIYLNDFSNNYGSNSRDDGANNWDYDSQGNYWDDYNDYDSNKDGIGDNPYQIAGNGDNQDNFPLGDFLSISQPVAYIDFISPNPAPKGSSISFSGHGTTPTGIIVAWEWKSDNILISNTATFTTSSISAGSHSISFRVQNNNEIWSEKVYKTLIVNPNQKPSAYIIEPDGQVEYGTAVNFSGYGVDPDGEIKAYLWHSVPNFISSTNSSFTLNNIPVENYTIYFKVKDNEGEWSAEASTKLSVLQNTTGPNDPPVANAKGPYFGLVNQTISFDGSSSFDQNDNELFFHWDFGDGTTSQGALTDHKYNIPGNYSVQLTVTDEYGLSAKSSTYANVSSETNNSDNQQNKQTPGFATICVLCAISMLVIIVKINNKKRRN
jgi:parallel beta-helix repeat protein